MSALPKRLLFLLPLVALALQRQAAATLDQAVAHQAAAVGATALTRVAAPAAGTLRARDAAAAQAALAGLLGDRAARLGVRLTVTPRSGAADGLAQVAIAARGDEAAVHGFSLSVEGAHPLIRWIRWRLAPTDAGLELQAVAAAPWRS